MRAAKAKCQGDSAPVSQAVGTRAMPTAETPAILLAIFSRLLAPLCAVMMAAIANRKPTKMSREVPPEQYAWLIEISGPSAKNSVAPLRLSAMSATISFMVLKSISGMVMTRSFWQSGISRGGGSGTPMSILNK